MKNNTHFFYCSFHVTVLFGQVGDRHPAKEPIHHYRELVEVGKNETMPEVFSKWLDDRSEDLKSKWATNWNPDPVLTYAFVLAP